VLSSTSSTGFGANGPKRSPARGIHSTTADLAIDGDEPQSSDNTTDARKNDESTTDSCQTTLAASQVHPIRVRGRAAPSDDTTDAWKDDESSPALFRRELPSVQLFRPA
jgi:hypothetical protein